MGTSNINNISYNTVVIKDGHNYRIEIDSVDVHSYICNVDNSWSHVYNIQHMICGLLSNRI